VYLPVHVPGAKFSVGDLHFSQGDGEISFCGAIEMAGVITINFRVLRNGLADLGLKSPIYIPGPVEPQFGPGRYIYFEGFSVDEAGRQRMFYSSPLHPRPFPSLPFLAVVHPSLKLS
jgi:formamidase